MTLSFLEVCRTDECNRVIVNPLSYSQPRTHEISTFLAYRYPIFPITIFIFLSSQRFDLLDTCHWLLMTVITRFHLSLLGGLPQWDSLSPLVLLCHMV